MSSRPPHLLPVPFEIRPRLGCFRVEILFWGVRELQRIQLMAVDRPKVTIEFGGEHVSSDTIQSAKLKPNFPNPIKYIDLRLPEDEHFWPPLMIQCEDCRQFGRHVLVGNHVIPTVVKYIWRAKQQDSDSIRFEDIPQSAIDVGRGHDNPAFIHDEVYSETEGSARQREASVVQPPQGGAQTPKGDLAQAVAKTEFLASGARSFSMASRNLTGVGGGNGSRMASPAGTLHQESAAGRVTRQPSRLASVQQGPSGSPGSRPQSRSSAMAMPNVAVRSPGGSVAPVDNDPNRPISPARNGAVSPPGSPQHAADTALLIPEKGAGGVDGPATMGRTPGGPPGLGGPGTALAIKKKKKVPKEELEEVDWWSRFYASIDDMEDQDDDDESGSDIDVLNDIQVDIKSEGKNDDVVDIPEDDDEDGDGGKKKKKKKKKKDKKDKKKKKKKKGLPFRRADSAKVFMDEKDSELEFEDNVKEDNSWIERIKIFNTPLEEARDFNGFESFVKTFPLYKGKQEDDEEPSDNRVVGYFKGHFLIYRLEDEEFGREVNPKALKLHSDLPSNEPVTMLVRIYVIRASDLHPTDPNGKSDPYLLIKLGGRSQNDKENYIPKQLNPVFGKCFEMEVKFPQESMLLIQVMDWDMVSGDDLIGETKIDLENRYYSKHRATCGISNSYDTAGYNKWRDQVTPSQILTKQCKEWHLDPPVYEPMFNRVTVSGKEFFADSEIEDESGELKQSNEPLALEVLKKWKEVTGMPLVQEHIETRPLFNPEKPGIEQGRLEMWVDMFPKEFGAPSASVDITPRVPKSFELRVIVWNTDEVILNDDGLLTGEKSSDIFVKGWMKGLGMDDQVTDVHYRSLSGEGNFNWRFIFQFDYLKAEDKIVYKTKESPFSIDETEIKAPCRLNLQVWDADIVSADDFLGGLDFPLSKIPKGAKSSKSCGLHQLAKDGTVPNMSIFRNKRCRGWWPFVAESEDDPNELEVTGKIDAEMQLMTIEEAEQNPAGLGRADPNALPPPNRPDTSFFSFMNPLKVIKYLVCGRYKWLLIKLLIITLLAALLVLFIYNSPGYLAKKMLGA